MITIIFAVICLGFIAYLLNKNFDLEKEAHELRVGIDELGYRVAISCKNYSNKINELKKIIKKLEITIIDQNNSIQKYKEMYVKEKIKTSISNSKKPKKTKGRRISVRNSRKNNS